MTALTSQNTEMHLPLTRQSKQKNRIKKASLKGPIPPPKIEIRPGTKE